MVRSPVLAGCMLPVRSSCVDERPSVHASIRTAASPATTQNALAGQRESDVTATNVTLVDAPAMVSVWPGASVNRASTADGLVGPHAVTESRQTINATQRMRSGSADDVAVYSSRRATLGSSLDARHAGSPQATTAIARKPAAIARNVTGSVGFTPTSIVLMAPVRSNAAAMPIVTPTALRRRPCTTIIRKMLLWAAPKAMRTPISG